MLVLPTMRLRQFLSWHAVSFCAILAAGCACAAAQQTQPAGPQPAGPQPSRRVLLDRVVALVNNQAILASDVETAMRLSVLEPRAQNEAPDARSTLNRLISRNLIQQQIRHEEEASATPTEEEVQARIAEAREKLPACVAANCSSDQGWKAFLAKNRITPDEVETYMRLRLEFLSFIETRFRQGIHIAPEEIESYYKTTLLPEYPAGQTAPTLDSVSKRIEEVLLQEQVNKLFSAWLDNLRKQGDVQILDPSLEMPAVQASQGGGNE
ncbi:MAG TPA: peptidylprolyl isomerase [Terracidiphilus sp.]